MASKSIITRTRRVQDHGTAGMKDRRSNPRMDSDCASPEQVVTEITRQERKWCQLEMLQGVADYRETPTTKAQIITDGLMRDFIEHEMAELAEASPEEYYSDKEGVAYDSSYADEFGVVDESPEIDLAVESFDELIGGEVPDVATAAEIRAALARGATLDTYEHDDFGDYPEMRVHRYL